MTSDKQPVRTTHEDDVMSIRETFKSEWGRRTWYGKLWYPLWALNRIIFAAAFAFACIFLMALLNPGELFEPIIKRISAGISWLRGLTPEVYDGK